MAAVVVPIACVVACTTPDDGGPTRLPIDTGTVPQAAQKIMGQPAYSTARWTYHVEDPKSGLVLLSNRAGEMVFTGPTAMLLTVGTAYDTIGPDTRLTTPVYAAAPVADGVVEGDLVLVAAGDLALGGRGAMHGRADTVSGADGNDHIGGIYGGADGGVGADVRKPPGNPLAGLDDLARQIAAKGVRTVTGDVVVDTRLWTSSKGRQGLVTPIFVNDNILDIEVSPGPVGRPATLTTTPRTAAFTVVSRVDTVDADGPTDLEVDVDPRDPRNLVVSGTIAGGAPQLVIYRIPDPASWARTLFVEALARAGITVTAPIVGPNDTSRLPGDDYRPDLELASLRSPPLREMGTMILQTSYNTGADALLCLLAVQADSTDCVDGLKVIREATEKAGMVSDRVVLTDGEGAYPASVTAKQMAGWMRWAATQPWERDFVASQPVLGESGSLAAFGTDGPARGKVAAKSGTVAAVGDAGAGRLLVNVQRLAGFLTTDDGRQLVFDLSMSGATFPDVTTGINDASADVAGVAAAFQQHLSGK